jgi:hypothetical protein
MSALERAAGEAEAAALRKMLRRGAILVWAAILPYAVLEVALLVLDVSRGLRSPVVPARVAIDAMVVWMVAHGSRGARRWIAFFSGVGLLFSLGMFAVRPSAQAALSVAECGFALWVFTVSAEARAYLEARARVVAS